MDKIIIEQLEALKGLSHSTIQDNVIDDAVELIKSLQVELDELKEKGCTDLDCSNHVQEILLEKEQLQADIAKRPAEPLYGEARSCILKHINNAASVDDAIRQYDKLQAELEKLKEEQGTLIYCHARACTNNIQLTGCPKGRGMCSIESVHLHGYMPDADNVFACSEFTER